MFFNRNLLTKAHEKHPPLCDPSLPRLSAFLEFKVHKTAPPLAEPTIHLTSLELATVLLD
jgi:hypothetical protein